MNRLVWMKCFDIVAVFVFNLSRKFKFNKCFDICKPNPCYSSSDIPTLAQLMDPNSAQFSEIFELIARRHPKHLQHLRILHTVERKFAKTLGIHLVIDILCLQYTKVDVILFSCFL